MLDSTALVAAVFLLVYLGMLLGKLPGLALDRTGVALLGAIVLVAGGALRLDTAWQAIDVPTMGLLFGLMIVSAQFRLGGFYARLTRRLAELPVGPPTFLALVIAVAGLLSAVLANDIVCLAMAPVLTEGCIRRRLQPVPALVALACAANVGSAATLIGNPQNMLIGQVLELSFSGYLAVAAVPVALGLVVTWGLICWQTRGQWQYDGPVPAVETPPLDAWQTGKGVAILVLLVAAFLVSSWPRELLALAAAGLLLTSRRLHSHQFLTLVDWHLLVLFAGLFVVNGALEESGLAARGLAVLADLGLDLRQPAWLFGVTVVLSNLVSNVPATMLLLPVASDPLAGPILALASTLAGNLIVVGSIANIIVIDQAQRLGVRIGWLEHARIGVPVTVATLAISAVWLVLWNRWF